MPSMRSFYRMGRVAVGAEPQADLPPISELQGRAKKLADGSSADHLVVAIQRDGTPVLASFPDAARAADLFGKLGDQPAGAVYVALFDKTQKDLAANSFIKDEAFFAATQEVHTHTATKVTHSKTTQSKAGWIAAGVAGLAGIVALGGKKRPHGA